MPFFASNDARERRVKTEPPIPLGSSIGDTGVNRQQRHSIEQQRVTLMITNMVVAQMMILSESVIMSLIMIAIAIAIAIVIAISIMIIMNIILYMNKCDNENDCDPPVIIHQLCSLTQSPHLSSNSRLSESITPIYSPRGSVTYGPHLFGKKGSQSGEGQQIMIANRRKLSLERDERRFFRGGGEEVYRFFVCLLGQTPLILKLRNILCKSRS